MPIQHDHATHPYQGVGRNAPLGSPKPGGVGRDSPEAPEALLNTEALKAVAERSLGQRRRALKRLIEAREDSARSSSIQRQDQDKDISCGQPGDWQITGSNELKEDELEELEDEKNMNELMEEEHSGELMDEELGELTSEFYESGELMSDSLYLSTNFTHNDSAELWAEYFWLNLAPPTPVAAATPVDEEDINDFNLPVAHAVLVAHAVTWAFPLRKL